MANSVMELLQRKLEERKKLVVESVGNGAAKDYATRDFIQSLVASPQFHTK